MYVRRSSNCEVVSCRMSSAKLYGTHVVHTAYFSYVVSSVSCMHGMIYDMNVSCVMRMTIVVCSNIGLFSFACSLIHLSLRLNLIVLVSVSLFLHSKFHQLRPFAPHTVLSY